MTKSTQLLKYYLEGNEDEEIITQLCETLNFLEIKEKLVEEYKKYITDDIEKGGLGLEEAAKPWRV